MLEQLLISTESSPKLSKSNHKGDSSKEEQSGDFALLLNLISMEHENHVELNQNEKIRGSFFKKGEHLGGLLDYPNYGISSEDAVGKMEIEGGVPQEKEDNKLENNDHSENIQYPLLNNKFIAQNENADETNKTNVFHNLNQNPEIDLDKGNTSEEKISIEELEQEKKHALNNASLQDVEAKNQNQSTGKMEDVVNVKDATKTRDSQIDNRQDAEVNKETFKLDLMENGEKDSQKQQNDQNRENYQSQQVTEVEGKEEQNTRNFTTETREQNFQPQATTVGDQIVLQKNTQESQIQNPIPIKEVPRFITQQMTKTLNTNQGDNTSEVTIRLKPENLGKLLLRITTSGESITVKIVTENSITKSLVEQNLSQLRQSLQEQGIKNKVIDVEVGGDNLAQHFNQKEQQFSKQDKKRSFSDHKGKNNYLTNIENISEQRSNIRHKGISRIEILA